MLEHNREQKISILNGLIGDGLLTDKQQVIDTIDCLINETDIETIYYYELLDESEPLHSAVNYFSGLEFDLVNIINCGLGIGYIQDLIYNILLKHYSKRDLNGLSSETCLKLFNIHNFKTDYSNILIWLFDTIEFNSISQKYIKLSLESFIGETDKLNFLKDILTDL